MHLEATNHKPSVQLGENARTREHTQQQKNSCGFFCGKSGALPRFYYCRSQKNLRLTLRNWRVARRCAACVVCVGMSRATCHRRCRVDLLVVCAFIGKPFWPQFWGEAQHKREFSVKHNGSHTHTQDQLSQITAALSEIRRHVRVSSPGQSPPPS